MRASIGTSKAYAERTLGCANNDGRLPICRDVTCFEAASVLQNPPSARMHDWTARMEAVAQCRDRDSFMHIYDHFAPRVRHYLQGLGVRNSLAEELAQEALLRVWQRAHQYDPNLGSLTTWLFRIARNLHLDRVRREPIWHLAQAYLDDLDSAVAGRWSVATETYAEESNVRHAVEQLPDIQARLIRMSYFEAKSQQAIANELGMPLGTVKSHLRRAFLTLQAELACKR